ncbi:MAG: SH3 domain-containing protein [Burkholderiaceae bacterium]|nr:SH3 domain-containing protein [Burkholderiaceae bacterium]
MTVPSKKSLAAASLSLAVLLAGAFGPADAQSRQMVSVDRPEINMRTGPGTGHDSVWLLSRGYPLQVLGRKGKWLQVKDFENDRGWVYRPLTDRTPHFVVKTKVANIRKGPSTRTRIVGKAEYGDVLRTLAHKGDWAKIRDADGLVGWVARRLLWGW